MVFGFYRAHLETVFLLVIRCHIDCSKNREKQKIFMYLTAMIEEFSTFSVWVHVTFLLVLPLYHDTQ